jgi:hypothetical protein
LWVFETRSECCTKPPSWLVLITNLMHSFIYSIIMILNMFQASLCSSSGGQIVYLQFLVSSRSVSYHTVHWLRADSWVLRLSWRLQTADALLHYYTKPNFWSCLLYFMVTNLEGVGSIIQYLLTTLCVFIVFHVSQDFCLCVTEWFQILDLCLILFHQ